jgi:IQ calmodulin-binding motif
MKKNSKLQRRIKPSIVKQLLTPRIPVAKKLDLPSIYKIKVSTFNKNPYIQERSNLPLAVIKKVIKVQALGRRFIVRLRFLKYVKVFHSALIIQSAWRGYSTRKLLGLYKRKKCPDCQRILSMVMPDIRSLRLEMSQIAQKHEELANIVSKYEQAFRYLFDQLAKLKP